MKNTNKKSVFFRGTHYYFRSDLEGDAIVISVCSYDGIPFQRVQLMPKQVDDYLALTSLEERRNYLYNLNPFGVRTKQAGVPAEVLERDLDAIFLSVNKAMQKAGIYVITEMELTENIERF